MRSRTVQIEYTNYRGERKKYSILPARIWFGKTRHHPREQWLLDATDVDRNVGRTFALEAIHHWMPELP